MAVKAVKIFLPEKDAVDGYHSIPLDEESQPLTTFITEWGRFMYLRMPQGYVASGDAYTRRYDEIIKDIPRKIKVVDDILLYDKTIKDAFYHTLDYLSLLLLLYIVAFYSYSYEGACSKPRHVSY